MRKISTSLLFVVILVLFMASCIKPIKDEGPKPVVPNMTCRVNDSAWAATASATVDGQGRITIHGVRAADSEDIRFTVLSTRPCWYAFGHNAMTTGQLILNKSNPVIYTTDASNNAGGKVEITSIDEKAKTVSGTFVFSMTLPNSLNTRNITNGVFKDIPITGDLPLKSSAVYAVLNGYGWNAKDISVHKADKMFSFTATGNDGQSFSFALNEDIYSAEYFLSETGHNTGTYTRNKTIYKVTSGTMILGTVTDTEIKGGFNITAVNIANPVDEIQVETDAFDLQF